MREVPIVQEFEDVFLENLPSAPLDRQIEFVIDLAPEQHQYLKYLIEWHQKN